MLDGMKKALLERRLTTALYKRKKNFPKAWDKFRAEKRKELDVCLAAPYIWITSRRKPIAPNKIVIITSRGEFDCNAKWIARELLRRRLPYQLVWTIRKKVPTEQFPRDITLVYRQSQEFYHHIATAKVIIDNSIGMTLLGYTKKKGQVLIETWHGSLGIKRFAADSNKDRHWVSLARRESRMTDYIISNAHFEDTIYRESFWKTTPILRLGHARNDILCEQGTWRLRNIRYQVFEYFSLDPSPEADIRLCLYAPTFRDDGDLTPYQLDYAWLKRALEVRFGGNWVVLTRFHFMVFKHLKKYTFPEGVVDASRYPDIYELLTCVDVGITDYSSWICDYMLTRRPGFLFATDMAEYEKKDRDFFYPLDTMPFPLALDNCQLIENILNFDYDTFVPACHRFLEEKGCVDDGHASERIADAIEAIMRGEQPS